VGRPRLNSVLNHQERLELLEQRVAYVEHRLRQWDSLNNDLRRVLSVLDPARLGNSSLSSALTELLRVTDNAPGPDSYQGVRLGASFPSLLVGNSQS